MSLISGRQANFWNFRLKGGAETNRKLSVFAEAHFVNRPPKPDR